MVTVIKMITDEENELQVEGKVKGDWGWGT